MEKYIYQMFILGTGNLDLPLKKGLGGVILFSKDIENENQVKALITHIKKQSLIPPFVSIDQEGGRVERTENLYPKRISARFAFEKGEDFLKSQYEKISSELKYLGFNLNFAPCIDVNTNPNNPIIGERAFSDNPDNVIKGAEVFINALKKYGIIPCAKHYPGHGDADKDSHLTLPTINLSMKEMEDIHIKPFKYAVENGIEMIMAAHLYCKCFDKQEIPASLSLNALSYLRNNLNYDGVIISDDMVMKGVQKYGGLEACILGINAGLNMFIFRESDNETLQLIEDLIKYSEKNSDIREKIISSYERIIKLKQKFCII